LQKKRLLPAEGHFACFFLRLGLNARRAIEWLQNRIGQFLSNQNHRQDLSLCCSNQKGTVMNEVAQNMAWAVVFSALGGIIGIALILAASVFLPRFIERLTPNIDEDKEIARGNLAVANYFGRIVGASIIGISIVVAAAVLGGIIAALH
jgi:ABC-type multidrug transport system fused ATPase/permease subunit